MARTILVVEDDPTQAEHVRRLLEGAGYLVHLAANGREGLQSAQSAAPDLIISDVGLPEMDGYALCRAVKSAEATKRIPFVLLTKRKSPIDVIHGLEIGADNFITKPFEDDYLLERVRRIFEHLEFRRKGYLEVEVTVHVAGRDISITADKQQIIELLFTSFEELERVNERLEESQRIVERHAEDLEAEVRQRTRQLWEAEAKYRTLIEHLPVVTYSSALDGVGRMLYVSPQIEGMLGFSQADWIADPELWSRQLHGDDRQRVLTEYARACASGKSFRSEYRIHARDGRVVWMYDEGALVRDETGHAMFIHGALLDITSRKRAEEALQESEERAKRLVELCPIGIMVGDTSGNILEVNDAFVRMLGYTREEILSRTVNWRELTPPELRHLDVWAIEEVKRTGTHVPFEKEYVHKGGTRVPVLVGTAYLGGPDELGIGFLVDITERKQAEEALREMNLALANAMPGISRLDARGRYVSVNQVYARMMGFEPHEMVGSDWTPTVHLDDRGNAIAAYNRMVADGSGEFEARAVRKDGSGFHKHILMVKRVDEQGTLIGHHCFMRDITDRKQAEQIVEHSRALLQSFVEHTPAAVAMFDKKLRYVAVSRRWLYDYRLGDQNIIGRHHYDVFPEIRKRKDWQEIHQRCLAGAVEGRDEDRFVRQDGSEDWLRWEVRPWYDVGGEIGGIIMFTEVITERKRAEEALRESEDRYRDLVEHSHDLIGTHDLEGNILSVNQQTGTALGCDPSKLQMKNIRDFLAPEVRDEFDAYLARIRSDGAASGLMQVQTSLGERRVWEYNNTLRTEGVAAPIVRGVARDITDRMRVEKELKRTLSLLNATLESTADGLLVVDQTGKIVSFNHTFVDMWRIPESVLASRDDNAALNFVLDQLEDHEAFLRKVRELYDQPDAQSFDVLSFKDGRTFERYSQPQRVGEKSVGRVWSFRDVTERKRAEEALLEKEHLLAESQRIAHIGSWLYDMTGRIVWSDEMYRIYGVSFTPNAESFLSLIHPEDRPAMQGWIAACLAEEKPGELEFRTILPDGAVRFIGGRGELKYDAENRPTHMAGTAQDITERKRAEEALTLFRSLIDHTNDVIEVVDPETGRFLDVNEKACQAHGYTREEYLALTVPEIDPLVGARPWAEIREEVRRSGSRIYDTQHRRKDGFVFPVEVNVTYIRLDRDYMVAVVRDITERKQAEKALLASQQQLRLAIESANVGLWDWNLQTNEVWFSPEWKRQLGYAEQELPGRYEEWESRLHPQDRGPVLALLRACLNPPWPVYDLEFRLQHKDGTYRSIYVRGEVFRDAQDQPLRMLGCHVDITERKRAEEQILREKKFSEMLINSSVDGILAFDLDCRYTTWNLGMERISGVSGEKCLGRCAFDVFPFLKETGEDRYFYAALEGRTAIAKDRPYNVPETSRAGFFEGHYSPLRSGSGEIVGGLAIIRDITERKRAEETLQALYKAGLQIQEPMGLQERLDRLLKTARDVLQLDRLNILLSDPEGQWLQAVASLGGDDSLEAIRVPTGPAGGGLAQAYRTQQMVVWDGRGPVPEALRLQPPYDRIAAFRSQVFANVPLVVQGRAIGVLGADRKHSQRALDLVTLELLHLFAAQAAVAIQNARLFEQVQAGRERLQTLSRQLVAVQEAERHHLARELHDEIGQMLTGVKLTLEMSMRSSPDAIRTTLGEAQRQLNDLMARVRMLSLDLRPAMLDDLGLVPALLWHFERYTAQTSVQVDFRQAGLEGRLRPELETAVYRIVQEALTNVARHAGVNETTVILCGGQDILGVQVQDQGRGFNPLTALGTYTSSGLAGMSERAELLGGHLKVESAPGAGTSVTAKFPVIGRIDKRKKPR